MSEFRYQAVATTARAWRASSKPMTAGALQLLGQRGLFPSRLELNSPTAKRHKIPPQKPQRDSRNRGRPHQTQGCHRLDARNQRPARRGIPIPQGVGQPGRRGGKSRAQGGVKKISETVRKGVAFSVALEEHPKLFGKLYSSMVRVGEEGGVLPKVMADLADLLEHEDEVRGEVTAAVAYPVFVLVFGICTVTVLLTVVLPRLFSMLQDMLPVLPLPTLILLKVSHALHSYWPWILIGLAMVAFSADRWYLRTPRGRGKLGQIKLRLPLIGPVVRAAALGRFARTLGTLVKSGVSLLPALENCGKHHRQPRAGPQVARVAEETRGGDSLATPLRKLGFFPARPSR
jgi:type II secretory pathway component PulF